MQFRLRDLLVLIFVLSVLLTLGMQYVARSREEANKTSCANNLKQLGLGIHNYHDTWKCLPPSSTGRDAGPRIGWQVRIIPFTEHTSLWDQLNLKSPNLPLAKASIDLNLMIGPPNIKTYNQTAEIQVP